MAYVATLTAQDVARGVMRLFAGLGASSMPEFPLGNGRRADVAALNTKGQLSLVEIKVAVADLKGDFKWPEYLDFCDAFYFAVPEDFPLGLLDEDHRLPGRAGLIIANRFEAVLVRPAAVTPLNAARRKAETLRFACRAADRLRSLLDPGPLGSTLS
jgi:hypothetical protein